MTYPQQIVLVKSGEKDAEKRFLGYEFSNRRGSEGIHPIQRGKTIDECTQLFDANSFDNDTKASFYVYSAFKKEFPAINESLQKNISYINLVDALTFDRAHFEKTISTAIKKKVKIESKYPFVSIGDIANKLESGSRPTGGVGHILEGCLSLGGEHIDNTSGCLNLTNPKFVSEEFYQSANNGKLQKNDVLICKDGALTGKVAIVRNELENINAMINEHLFIVRCENVFTQKYLFHFLFFQEGQELLKQNITGTAQGGLNSTNLKNIKIPLPPLEIQQKIVSEIEAIENKEKSAKEKIEELKGEIENSIEKIIRTTPKVEMIKNIAQINPSKSEIKNLDENTLISFVEMVSVSNLGFIETKIDKKYKEVKKGSYTYFKEEDIIIAKITPCMENGKCALAKDLTNNIALGSSEFHVIRTAEKVNNKFLFLLLNRKSVRELAEKQMTGASGHRRVPASFYEQFQIPLPPISEQQKIVAKIEVIETQIAELEQSSTTYKAEKEAVLQKYL